MKLKILICSLTMILLLSCSKDKDANKSKLKSIQLADIKTNNQSAIFQWQFIGDNSHDVDISQIAKLSLCKKNIEMKDSCEVIADITGKTSHNIQQFYLMENVFSSFFVKAEMKDINMQIISNLIELVGEGTNSLIQTLSPQKTGDFADYIHKSQFGRSITTTEDGSLIAVSAPAEIVPGAWHGGAVYIYRNNKLEQRILPKVSDENDFFGNTIAFSGNGKFLVVSSTREKSVSVDDPYYNSPYHTGALYIFAFESGKWIQKAMLKPSDLNTNIYMGSNISVNQDASVIAATSSSFGHVYIFKFDPNVDTWVERKKFPSTGRAIALDQTGKKLFIGDYTNDENKGIVRYYEEQSDQDWQLISEIKPDIQDPNDRFGCCLDISLDTNTLLVGAYGEKSNSPEINGDVHDNSLKDAGAAYVFKKVNGIWVQQVFLKPVINQTNFYFGSSTKISADGNTILISSTSDNTSITGIHGNTVSTDSSTYMYGAAHYFKLINDEWIYYAYIKPPILANEFAVGIALFNNGKNLIISTPNIESPKVFIY